jgi:DNA-binding transcriptional ArsR family regulator
MNYDSVFSALSDATRRGVVARLARSPASASELAKPFNMALPSFLQHMSVLEKAGLVRSRKHGRVRTYALSHTRLRLAETWLERQRAMWQRRLNQFDSYVTNLHKETANHEASLHARSQTRPRIRARR